MKDDSISEDLHQFFGAYFHEDAVFDAENWQEIVDEYVDDDPTAEPLQALAREIEALRETLSESDLERLLRKIHLNYIPQHQTYTEWLGQVAERLRLHADGIAANRSTP